MLGLVIFAWAATRDVALQLGPVAPEGAERAARALTPWFGVAATIWVVVLADPAIRFRGRMHAVMMLLGNASYAIYLWHEIPQRVLGRLIGSVGLTAPIEAKTLATSGCFERIALTAFTTASVFDQSGGRATY